MSNEFSKLALMSIVGILLVCMLTQQAYAQRRDSLLTIYNNQTIHTFGKVYMKGGQRMNFRDLSSEFQSDLTRDLYRQSKKSLSLSRVLSVVSVATLVSSAVLRKNQNDSGFALLAVGIGINFFNGRIRKKSTELVDQAIWLRNREVLFNVRE